MKRNINNLNSNFSVYISKWLFKNHFISNNDKDSLAKDFINRDPNYIVDFLISEDIADKNDILRALSNYYKVPYIDVIGVFFDHYLLKLFPKDVMLKYYFIPYERNLDILTVIAANPDSSILLSTIGQYISHDINFMVSIANDIKDSIEEFYSQSNTYQPYSIANQLMERSMIDVHPSDELVVEDHPDEIIPLIIEDNIDDYESK